MNGRKREIHCHCGIMHRRHPVVNPDYSYMPLRPYLRIKISGDFAQNTGNKTVFIMFSAKRRISKIFFCFQHTMCRLAASHELLF